METKTQEQVRGAILEKRLKTLNEFLFKYAGTDKPFGEYLSEIGINEARFLSELPDDLLFNGISNEKADSKQLLDYGQALNLVYNLQHLKHINNTDDFSSLDVEDAPIYGADAVITYDSYGDDFLYGSGKGWFKKTKNNLKNESKKAERKARRDARREKRKNKEKKNIFRKLLHATNKLNPVTAIPRNAFISLLSINATALANAFNHIENDKDKTEWNKILKIWDTLGGSKKALTAAIEKGSKKKPFPNIKKKKHRADGDYHNGAGGDESVKGDSIDATNPANAGKVAAGSAAGLTGLAGILASNPATAPAAVYVASGAVVLGATAPILKNYAQRKGEDTTGIETPAITGLDPDTMVALKSIQQEKDDAGFDIADFFDEYKWWFAGGIVAIVGGVMLFAGGDKNK